MSVVGARTPAAARLTRVWLALCALTAVSAFLGPERTGLGGGVSTPITAAVLALALVKARLVIRHFMEVRTAPVWLRVVTDGWLAALWGSILALYLW